MYFLLSGNVNWKILPFSEDVHKLPLNTNTVPHRIYNPHLSLNVGYNLDL